MRKLINLMCLVGLLVAATACSGDEPDNNYTNPPVEGVVSRAIDLTDEEMAAGEAVKDFDYNLLKSLCENGIEENVVVSPFSAQFTLAMLANAMDEDARGEITDVLGCDDLSSLNAFNGKCLKAFPGLDSKITVGMANSIWYDTSRTLNPEFGSCMSDVYGADLYARDMTVGTVLDDMNGWCSDKTNGLIPSMFNQLPPVSMATIINALYFNGKWNLPFDEDQTRCAGFNTGDEIYPIDMMNNEGEYPYAEADGYKAVRMDMGKKCFSVTFVLPDEGIDIDTFINSFDYSKFSKSEFTDTDIVLGLPRFKVISDEMRLDEVLMKMGVRKVLTGATASFFTEPVSGRVNISQKTTIEFTEKGAEASAVTSTIWLSGGVGPQKPIVIFNRPYLFFLTENSSGACLMAGKIGRPNESEYSGGGK